MHQCVVDVGVLEFLLGAFRGLFGSLIGGSLGSLGRAWVHGCTEGCTDAQASRGIDGKKGLRETHSFTPPVGCRAGWILIYTCLLRFTSTLFIHTLAHTMFYDAALICYNSLGSTGTSHGSFSKCFSSFWAFAYQSYVSGSSWDCYL